MLVTEMYNGQGLGNQLWCYVVTRAIAKKNGYDFGIMTTEKFKGREFLDLDFGEKVIGGSGPEGGPPTKLPYGINKYYKEKITRHPNGSDISLLDYNLLNIEDNTKIDGVMQDEKYFIDIKKDVIEWLRPNKSVLDYSSDDICVIHVRGGDFKKTPAVLDGNYYLKAIDKMKSIKKGVRFVVVTDDVKFTKNILPGFEIVGGSVSGESEKTNANHHMGGPIYMDYTILNNAKYVILGASSFAWWAIWTNEICDKVIAPKYWARHRVSDGYWSTGGSITKGWDYLDRSGQLFTYDQCMEEYNKYKEKNKL